MHYQCTNQETPRKNLSRCIAGGMAVATAVLSTCSCLTGCSNSNNIANDTPTSANINTEKPDSSFLMAEELTQSYQSKAIRASESVRTQIGEDAYLSEIAHLGSAEATQNQGEYIVGLLEDIKANQGEEKATQVMRACGYKCIDSSIIETAKNIYEESKDLQAFVEKLNAEKIGGGQLTLEGNKIKAIYDQCYCDVQGIKKDRTRCYCQCSCGWFEKLFATVLEQPVSVNLTESIKNSGQKCTFDIILDDIE